MCSESRNNPTYLGKMSNTTYTGSVEVTRADSVNRIVSGRFSFTAVSSTGKTIKVTDGRFDLNSNTQ